ncbi:MAG: sugar ABC transporter substrate-binding protein [Clostridiales bacterium]|nr:sugar ABC transporter substrate-binding protein [Clostridiales bacterium]
MKKMLCVLMALCLMLTMGIVTVASAEEPIKLTFSSWGDAAEKAILESALAKFTEETGIEVEYLYTPEDYVTKMTTMAAANELPDVGYLSEPIVVQWANEGMLLDLTPALESGNVQAKMDSNKFIDKNGNVVGVSVADEVVLIYYNPDYFDAMGVEYPPASGEEAWTWDEFVAVCKQLTVDQNGKHPDEEGFDPDNIRTYAVKMDDSDYVYESFLGSNNTGVFTEDKQGIALYSDEAVEVFQSIADLINVHHVMPSAEDAASSMDMSAAFLSNSCAMVVTGQWAFQSLAIAAEEDGINYDVGVLPYFAKPNTANTGTPVVVFKDTKHYEEALLLASYIMNTDFVIDFIHSGLWMPVSEDWYTDEALIDEWLTEGVHPEHYKTAVIDWAMGYTTPSAYFTMGCVQQVEDLYLPALDNVLLGTTTAKDAMEGIRGELDKVMENYLASIAG